MNIFVIDTNPRKAAEQLCDKHIVKMILESHQMLSTTVRELYIDKYKSIHHDYFMGLLPGAPKAHVKHPCTEWVMKSRGNYRWLIRHLRAMHVEYDKRYNKVHKQEGLLMIYEGQEQYLDFKTTRRTPFPQAMPEGCKDKDPVKAYQNYYNLYKFPFAKWKLGNIPEWFNPPSYEVVLEKS